jgi:fructose-1,6-bisphosphatase/inositol monophosphatase family enzyme
LIFEEAGGVVSDASGNPLDFSRGRYLDTMDRGIVAASPALHQQVIELIANKPELIVLD